MTKLHILSVRSPFDILRLASAAIATLALADAIGLLLRPATCRDDSAIQGLEPVILHEQVNRGRTIIEKFEDFADVDFAVVLLTPDDMGRKKDEKTDLNPRARQNVILELGFFLGKLGRQRVCPIVKGDVETPSDYDGVVYTDLDDAGGWKMKLVQELKDAGFVIDTNRMFQT